VHDTPPSDFNALQSVLQPAAHCAWDGLNLTLARVGFRTHNFKAIYRYENPFIYPPAFVAHDTYGTPNTLNFVYQDLKSTLE
jgi:hypothetical protein